MIHLQLIYWNHIQLLLLSSERKVMCWTPRSSTDRVTQYSQLSAVCQVPQSQMCQYSFSIFTGPVLAASWQTSHSICSITKKNLGVNRHSENIPESQPDETPSREKAAGSLCCIQWGQHYILCQSRRTVPSPMLLLHTQTSWGSSREGAEAVPVLNQLLICTVKTCRVHSYLVYKLQCYFSFI